MRIYENLCSIYEVLSIPFWLIQLCDDLIAYKNKMNFQQIKEQTILFFQTTSHPNVFSPDEPTTCTLIELKRKKSLALEVTTKIMDGVVNALICLMTHSFVPCQVRPQHIVRCQNKWGLKSAVCYRIDQKQYNQYNQYTDANQKTITYNPEEYKCHPDSQSELVWSLGKIWFEMLTGEQLPAYQKANQTQICKTLKAKVSDERITQIISKMLKISSEVRLSFQGLISSRILTSCSEIEDIYMKSSLVKHFNRVQQICISNVPNCNNPFLQQLFYRQLTQENELAPFYDQVKKLLKHQFTNIFDANGIDFTCEVIDAFRYVRYTELDKKRQIFGYNMLIYENKKAYSQFVKKIYFLNIQLNKVRKIPRFQFLKQTYKECFVEPENMRLQKIYVLHKNLIAQFLIQAKKIQKAQTIPKEQLKYQKLVVKLLITRTISYIFENNRTYLFRSFVSAQQKLGVANILKGISQCPSYQKLKELQLKILDLYMNKKA